MVIEEKFASELEGELAREKGKIVVQRENITPDDYVDFQAHMDSADVPREVTRDVWADLRDQNIIAWGDPKEKQTMIPELDKVDDGDVEALHLLVSDGCDVCESVKENMSEMIERGEMDVHRVVESDKGAEIAGEVGSLKVPNLVAELQDGEYVELG